MENIESIVNELVEKRVKEKLSSFVDIDENDYQRSQYDNILDDAIRQKILDIMAIHISKNEKQMAMEINRRLYEKFSRMTDEKIKVSFAVERY